MLMKSHSLRSGSSLFHVRANDESEIARIGMTRNDQIGRRRNALIHSSREIELGAVTRAIESAAPFGTKIGRRDIWAKSRHAAQVRAEPNRDEVLRIDRARGISGVCGLLRYCRLGIAKSPVIFAKQPQHLVGAMQDPDRLALPFHRHQRTGLELADIRFHRRASRFGSFARQHARNKRRCSCGNADTTQDSRHRDQSASPCEVGRLMRNFRRVPALRHRRAFGFHWMDQIYAHGRTFIAHTAAKKSCAPWQRTGLPIGSQSFSSRALALVVQYIRHPGKDAAGKVVKPNRRHTEPQRCNPTSRLTTGHLGAWSRDGFQGNRTALRLARRFNKHLRLYARWRTEPPSCEGYHSLNDRGLHK